MIILMVDAAQGLTAGYRENPGEQEAWWPDVYAIIQRNLGAEVCKSYWRYRCINNQANARAGKRPGQGLQRL